HVVVALIQRSDLDLLVLPRGRAGEARENDGETADRGDDRQDDDERLEGEVGDVKPEGHEQSSGNATEKSNVRSALSRGRAESKPGPSFAVASQPLSCAHAALRSGRQLKLN